MWRRELAELVLEVRRRGKFCRCMDVRAGEPLVEGREREGLEVEIAGVWVALT